ncbi:MAG: thiosulfohydrolase SoxB [Pseudomonadales bacterium]|nr:thiosulfohydrolase SoxB [Pseudomonadales bacterium]
MNRREFLQLLAQASVAAQLAGCKSLAASSTDELYRMPSGADVRLLHITDTHAQLQPVYFREPHVNLGVGPARGKMPHLVGQHLLDAIGSFSAREKHAFTYLDFTAAAEQFGRVGGFSHLSTLVQQMRASAPGSLLLDGGDTWQGSGTALWTRGRDMVGACNLLGVDVMTGHWEFTYNDDEVLENVSDFQGDFVANNVVATEDALFDGVEVFDEDSGHVFQPYVVKEVNGRRIAVIGQAFPYTPIANPQRFIPDWTFGIRESDLAEQVSHVRSAEKPDAVVLLSHNGMDVDLKLASRVSGIDVVLGGHTHDGIPVPVEVKSSGGITLVTNAGSNGKFLGVLDLKFGASGVSGYDYRLMPVFANMLEEDAAMARYIADVRKPYEDRLSEKLAETESLLFRRGNFNGSFDQVIVDALRSQLDAEIAMSPGFRWGTSLLPGDSITMEDVLSQTCITYPETYARDISGEEIKTILESVADNLFNADPYYQQGGDMVRTGGLQYECWPNEKMGQRIQNLQDSSGKAVTATRNYRVAGWATVGSKSPGAPVWDVVGDYLRSEGTISLDSIDEPVLRGVQNNPGLAQFS